MFSAVKEVISKAADGALTLMGVNSGDTEEQKVENIPVAVAATSVVEQPATFTIDPVPPVKSTPEVTVSENVAPPPPPPETASEKKEEDEFSMSKWTKKITTV